MDISSAIKDVTWFSETGKFHVRFMNATIIKTRNEPQLITLEIAPKYVQLKSGHEAKLKNEIIRLETEIRRLSHKLNLQFEKQREEQALQLNAKMPVQLQLQSFAAVAERVFASVSDTNENSTSDLLPANIEKWFAVGLDAAMNAGALIERFINDTVAKSNNLVIKLAKNDFQTQFDRQTEKLIVDKIVNAFPSHLIVGEESYKTGSEQKMVFSKKPTWIIDPIDGTTNFIHGQSNVGICIGLKYNQESVIGIVHAPLWKETYFAVKGKGAFMIKDGDFANMQRIHTNQSQKFEVVSDLKHMMVLNESGFYRHEQHCQVFTERIYQWLYKYQIRALRMFGSCSIHMCMVASGRADMFYEHGNLGPWDMAAGEVIVKEAGGCVMLPESKNIGEPFDCTQGKVLCCASKSCAKLIASLDVF